MPSLPDLASSLGVPPSTLRQGARVGYVRAEHLFVESGEAAYLRSHWSLLRSLTASLGQERGRERAQAGSDLDHEIARTNLREIE